jgi:hypothetical protein
MLRAAAAEALRMAICAKGSPTTQTKERHGKDRAAADQGKRRADQSTRENRKQGPAIRRSRAVPRHEREQCPAPARDAGEQEPAAHEGRFAVRGRMQEGARERGNTRLPAEICTWRMISIGAFSSVTTGSPARFQASMPPSSR